jgi:hypothetical protein
MCILYYLIIAACDLKNHVSEMGYVKNAKIARLSIFVVAVITRIAIQKFKILTIHPFIVRICTN